MENKSFSKEVSVFHGIKLPEKAYLAGYSALIEAFDLQVPLPRKLAMIGHKHKKYIAGRWVLYTPRHKPIDTLYGHLVFALKYEGVDLAVLKAVFKNIAPEEIQNIVESEPTSSYSRRIWFFYECLLRKKLKLQDAKKGNYVDALNSGLQYPGPSENSSRHRVKNNLPGVSDFCPLVWRTPTLEKYIAENLSEKTESTLSRTHRDIILRAAAFLLLKDSKASYAIEGENPPQTRLQRWGKIIGQAGKFDLSPEELLRLQKIVLESSRFAKFGWRKEGGFVGEHDREFGTPIPDHISAKPEDIEKLIDGLIETNKKLINSSFDPVIAATIIAFGFVNIHPFVDGNGRIHRYLIHHILAKKGFAKKNLVFPVSAAMLEKIDEYRDVLENYSLPRLNLIEWQPTHDNNVKVLNATLDLYSYFDATEMSEFLYSCVEYTIDEIIPEEVDYLSRYDEFKHQIGHFLDMPDKFIALLIRFLENNNGVLSKRARAKEFKDLTTIEISKIETLFKKIFVV